MKKKIGLVHGVFDVVHYGHILHFIEAKKKVEKLIVSVTSDKYVNKSPGKPIFSTEKRVKFLNSIKYIDEVIISDYPNGTKSIKKIKPDIYFKGKDYKDKTSVDLNLQKEAKQVKIYGGEVHYTDLPLYSSSKIINESFDFISDEVKEMFSKININIIEDKIYKVQNQKKKILIIGEILVDNYTFVETSGKSQKSSALTSSIIEEKNYGGGTILVSNVLNKFSTSKIELFNFLNHYNNKILNKYLEKGIKIKNILSPTKIIKKSRYIESYYKNKLYQIVENEKQRISKKIEDKVLKFIKKNYSRYDLIYIFDFGYYLFTNKIVKLINKLGSKKTIINCQSNSYNFGFNLPTKYLRGNILSMDEMEFRLAVKNRDENIESLLKENVKIFKKFNIGIVTCGKKGCFIVRGGKIYFYPSIFTSTVDNIGCGDIFLVLFGLFYNSKIFNMDEIAVLCHIAAGMHGNVYGNDNILDLTKLLKVSKNIIK